MKILSLFDGISCARVALERAGIKVDKYYASEIDKYAIQIAQKNYPDTVQLGDVRNITKEMVGDVDLIIGGSPCQDLSVARNNRKGLEGDNSGLFYEYVRILNEIEPRYFILENVNSMTEEVKKIISKELNCVPVMIDANLVSAQNRKRLFWTNISGDSKNLFGSYYIGQPKDKGILLEDILEENVDGRYYLSPSSYKNAIKNRKPKVFDTGKARGQMPLDRLKIGKALTLTTNCGAGENRACNLICDDKGIRRLTPIECERLQGLPDNYTEGVSNTQRYKALGNAFNVDVVAYILRFINKCT